MPICAECGASHHPEDRYCPRCGHRLTEADVSEAINTQESLDLFDVQYKLGLVYYRKGDYPRAVETWEKALKRRPGHIDLAALVEDAKSRCRESRI